MSWWFSASSNPRDEELEPEVTCARRSGELERLGHGCRGDLEVQERKRENRGGEAEVACRYGACAPFNL